MYSVFSRYSLSTIAFVFMASVPITTSPAFAGAQAKLGSFAWMSCSEKFSSEPKMALAAKGPARRGCASDPTTFRESFNTCRDQYGAKVLAVTHTQRGWLCRYSSATGTPRKP